MAAPDFYFASQAIFRHIHDRYGMDALTEYWRCLAREYYRNRIEAWRSGGIQAVADDWRSYFAKEPLAEVEIRSQIGKVVLDIQTCPAIRHLRESGREIIPYFCDHCDHTCGAMAEAANLTFHRSGGMGSCLQEFSLKRTASHEDSPC